MSRATQVKTAVDANVHQLEDRNFGTLAEQEASAVALTGGTIGPAVAITAANAAALSGAGTIQGDAIAITFGVSTFTTVGAGTGAILPAAVAGRDAVVFNKGANALLIYPATGEAINALAANAAYSLAATKGVILKAVATGQWHTILSA